MSGNGSRYYFGNLYRQGWQETARLVYRRARTWELSRQVLVAPEGDVFSTTAEVGSRWTKVVGSLVGVYRTGIQPNEIEDDFLAFFKEITAREKAA